MAYMQRDNISLSGRCALHNVYVKTRWNRTFSQQNVGKYSARLYRLSGSSLLKREWSDDTRVKIYNSMQK